MDKLLKDYREKTDEIIHRNLEEMQNLAVNEQRKDDMTKGEMAKHVMQISKEFQILEEKRLKDNKVLQK